jgi:hypothetical protein
MSSSVNDAYAAIKTAVEATLTGKTELANPYEIENNPFGFLKEGYGIAYGPAREAPNVEFKATWSLQSFDIHLTKETISLESNPEPLRATVQALHAEALSVIKAVLDPNIYPSGILYAETSAPTPIEAEKQIMSLTVTFVARTQDTL